MKPTEIPPQVYDFLAWLSHHDFVIRDRLPEQYEAPLAVARATDPPLVRIFNTGIVDEALQIDDKVIPLPPHFGIQLTREGGATLALYDMQKEKVSAATSDWPRQAEVARGLGLEGKAGEMEVKRLCDDGELKTNNKSGSAKRIDPASILAYCKREGKTYNET